MVRGYYQLKYYRSHSTKVRQVKSVRENVLVWFVTASYVVPGLLWLFTPIIAFEDFELSGYWRWSGFFISMLSMALFYRVHRILGDNWSPVLEIRKDHELIITGPYRWVRHPMYSSIWLGVLGHEFTPLQFCVSDFYTGIYYCFMFGANSGRRATDGQSIWWCLQQLCFW